MQATAEFSVNTMLTKKSANKVKTFFCGTQTEYKQADFDYGKLHDVTSVEWTQLMVYYSNRFSQLLFNQKIHSDVKNWKVHKTTAKLKTYIVHFFYHDMMEILTMFGPNPEIPKKTITNCTAVRTFFHSATNNVPFIHAYINMYIKYLATYINTKRKDDDFGLDELNALYHDLFPNFPEVNTKGGYENGIDLEAFRIHETFNINSILKNCILNDQYNWDDTESETVVNKFTWDDSYDRDYSYEMPLPETLVLPAIPKKLAVIIQHNKPLSRVIEAPKKTLTMDERLELYSGNLVFHIQYMHKSTSALKNTILSLPKDCSEKELDDFKTQATFQIHELLTKPLPIRPTQSLKRKRPTDESDSTDDNDDDGDDDDDDDDDDDNNHNGNKN
jgi:hypothetical protein